MTDRFQKLIDDGTVSDVVRNEAGEIVKATIHEQLKFNNTFIDQLLADLTTEELDELKARLEQLNSYSYS